MLNVGTYNISVESKGFKKFEILSLPLEFNQRAPADAVLTPGEVPAMGIDIDPSQIRDIPLANRDIFNLLNRSGGISVAGT